MCTPVLQQLSNAQLTEIQCISGQIFEILHNLDISYAAFLDLVPFSTTENNVMVLTLFLHNTPIKEDDSIKYLGITFTNSLT